MSSEEVRACLASAYAAGGRAGSANVGIGEQQVEIHADARTVERHRHRRQRNQRVEPDFAPYVGGHRWREVSRGERRVRGQIVELQREEGAECEEINAVDKYRKRP